MRVHVWLCGGGEKSAILIAPPTSPEESTERGRNGGVVGSGGVGVETIFVLDVFKLTARLKGVGRVQETARHIQSNS